jgi:ribosomal protein S12 methylthiotransferase
MKRPAHAVNTLDRIHAWRRECPDLTLRSTFIVGFPGETEAEFMQLLEWLTEAQLDRVGCFKYSPVEGATANALGAHVAPEVQQERYERFMEHAQAISAARLRRRVGQSIRVLVDAIDGKAAIARSEADAPEIDGQVRISNGAKLKVGEFAQVLVTKADAYDLTARIAPKGSAARQ